MRIAYIFVSLPFASQGEEFFFCELEEMLRAGQELVIIPLRPRTEIISEQATRLQSICLRQPLISTKILLSSIVILCKHPLRVLKALMLLRPHFFSSRFLKNLAVFPKSLWVARMIDTLKVDHIHSHWAATTATVALLASEITGVPWSFTAHRGDIVENNLLRIKIRKAFFVRFISKSGLELAREVTEWQQIINHRIIHMGVATNTHSGEGANKICGLPKVVCPAYLLPVKGHSYLIEAVGILAQRGIDCHLLLAGEGPLRKELERQVRQLSIVDRVKFLGHIPHEQLLKMYDQGDISLVVLPSVDLGGGLHEGIPVSLVEAMARGIPVVSTRTGGIKELIADGAGILVQDKNPDELADAIGSILSSKSLQRQLSAGARQRAQEAFSVEKVVQEIVHCMSSRVS